MPVTLFSLFARREDRSGGYASLYHILSCFLSFTDAIADIPIYQIKGKDDHRRIDDGINRFKSSSLSILLLLS